MSHGSSSVFSPESDNDLNTKGEKKKAKFTLGEEEDISENEEVGHLFCQSKVIHRAADGDNIDMFMYFVWINMQN